MENEKHYFMVGLFIIGLSVAAAGFAVWIAGAGRADDIRYKIYFADSVSGLAEGDPVKYRGVDVGTVERLRLAPDAQRVRADVLLRKEAPIRTDTIATLKLKGITGVLYVELMGGSPDAPLLRKVTPEDEVPEIRAASSGLNTVLDELPKAIEKFTKIEDRMIKVLSDKNIANLGATLGELREASGNANELTKSLKDDPSQLVFGKKKPKAPPPKTPGFDHLRKQNRP